MTNETTHAIDWSRAMADAEWLAGSTADTAERNLARAYLSLRDYYLEVGRCRLCHRHRKVAEQ